MGGCSLVSCSPAGYVTRYDCVSELESQQHVAPPAAWHYHSTPPHSDDAAVAVLILTNIVHQFVIVAVKILILEEYALHFQQSWVMLHRLLLVILKHFGSYHFLFVHPW